MVMSPCDNLGAIGLACGCARRSVAYRRMTRATPMTHRCLPSQMWRESHDLDLPARLAGVGIALDAGVWLGHDRGVHLAWRPLPFCPRGLRLCRVGSR